VGQRPEHGRVPLPAVDRQVPGLRGHVVQLCHGDRLVDGLLGHQAVGRPLAAGDRDQSRRGDQDLVLARQLGRVLGRLVQHERP